MASQVAEISPVMKQLNVVVDGQELTRELDKAYGKLSTTAKLKGFRAGKIPRQVLERYFRADVEKDVLNRVVSRAYGAAVEEHKLQPVGNPEVQMTEFIPGQDLQFAAKVEVKPAIVLKKAGGFTATRELPTITDELVEAEIQKMREQVSTIIPVEGRDVAQKGDLATTNFYGTIDGAGFAGGSGSAYVVDIGAGRFFVDAEAAMEGKKIGETIEVDLTIPETWNRNKDVRGKRAHFQLTITELKTRQTPALDDEFAKDLGEYESLADLRAKTRKGLADAKQDEAEAKMRDELMTQFIEANPFEIPPTMLERQIDARLYPMLGRMTPDQIRKLGVDKDTLREEQRGVAVRQIRGALLLEALCDQEKLTVAEADVEAHYAKLAERNNVTVERVRAAFAKPEQKAEILGRLRNDLALNHLTKNSTITDKKV